MMMMFAVERIARTIVNDDGKSIDVIFVTGHDEITIRFPIPDLATTASILAEAAAAAGPAAHVGQACKVPKKFTCGQVPGEPGFAMMILDQGLPSQQGWMMTGIQARTIGRGLVKAGRKALEARSQPRTVTRDGAEAVE